MTPTQSGQIVRFHTPFPDEDPNQLYVILESFFDVEQPRALIQALNFGGPLPPTNTILIQHLELAQFNPSDFLGKKVKVKTNDGSIHEGVAIKVENPKNGLVIQFIGDKLISNINMTISDKNGELHTGVMLLTTTHHILNTQV